MTPAPGATGRDRPARTVFFGSGDFAVPILDALVTAPEVEVIAAVGAPDRPAGRRGVPTAAPAVARARELGLAVLQPARLRAPETVDALTALAPDLGVLADYGRIVPPSILELPRHGILNVHPSLLPRHRGAAPVPATILSGDGEAGVTLIRMDDGIDTGPIVAAAAWPLDGTEIAPDLERRAAAEGAVLLRSTLAPWLAGDIEPRPQDDAAATLTRPLRREDGRLDPSRPVALLERQVRALQPWPGTWVETVAGRLAIWRARPLPAAGGDPPPGRFGLPGLRAGDGWLGLLEVQPAGGRRMRWEELVRGRPTLVGSQVVAPG